jgi:hypothetical protein
LDVFAFSAVAADDDGDAAIRHIDAFVQHAPGDQFAILPGAEAFEDGTAFLGGSLIGVM